MRGPDLQEGTPARLSDAGVRDGRSKTTGYPIAPSLEEQAVTASSSFRDLRVAAPGSGGEAQRPARTAHAEANDGTGARHEILQNGATGSAFKDCPFRQGSSL